MKFLCTHCSFETIHEPDFAIHLASSSHLNQVKNQKELFQQKPPEEKIQILMKEKEQLQIVTQSAIEDAGKFFEENSKLSDENTALQNQLHFLQEKHDTLSKLFEELHTMHTNLLKQIH